MTETDVLVNLDDPRTKDIAEAITNKTSKKILQELTKESMSVSEISKNLSLPLNTIDYNIKKLAQAGLIERKSFFWSPKGKKMHVYGIVNKRIIINPSSLGKKMAYFWAFAITGLLALGAKSAEYFSRATVQYAESSDMVLEAAPKMAEIAEPLARETASSPLVFTPGPIGWFLIGAWFAIILVIAISFLKDRKKS